MLLRACSRNDCGFMTERIIIAALALGVLHCVRNPGGAGERVPHNLMRVMPPKGNAMNANPKFLAATAHVDDAAIRPLPNSRKVHVGNLRVPMREVSQADTPTMFGGEKNPPLYVYDCSGPYTDPAAKIDIRSGLPALRERWIVARNDTEVLPGPSSHYGVERLNDPKLAEMRFNLKRNPRRGRGNVTQMHYARQGVVTPEMEFIAVPEKLQREAYIESLKATGKTGDEILELLWKQHPCESFGASIPQRIPPEFVR